MCNMSNSSLQYHTLLNSGSIAVGTSKYRGRSDLVCPSFEEAIQMDSYDIQHYIIQTISRRKYHAILKHPNRVLDIGTGTGIWMKSMSEDYPDCQFIGIDNIPPMNNEALPSNCRIESGNILKGINYPTAYFDYVHQRMFAKNIPKKHWKKHINECVRLCAPGGWVEIVECVQEIADGGPALETLNRYRRHVYRKDFDLTITSNLNALMYSAGLEKITVEDIRIPLGNWGGTVGNLAAYLLRKNIELIAPQLESTCNLTKDNLKKLMEEVDKELENGYASTRIRIFVGRKPRKNV